MKHLKAQLWLLLVTLAVGAAGQTPDLATMHDPALLVRVFDDPACGARWLLVHDQTHPGGPGLLLRESLAQPLALAENLPPENSLMAVRAGDRVLLEEHTRVVDATFEAIALGPARLGGRFQARLKLGGKVVQAEAVAAGRAIFAPGAEASQ